MGENTNIPDELVLIGSWVTLLADFLNAIGTTLGTDSPTDNSKIDNSVTNNMQQKINEMQKQLELQRKQFQKQQIQMQLIQLQQQVQQMEQQLFSKKSSP